MKITPVMQGNSWYLRTKVGAAAGKRSWIRLGVYGAENEAKAVRAATKILEGLHKTAAETRALTNAVNRQVEQLQRAGVDTSVKPVTRLGDWLDTYLATYTPTKATRQQKRDKAIIAWWRLVPFGDTRLWEDVKLNEFKPAHCLAALDHRRSKGTINPKWKDQRTVVAEATVQRERGLIQAVFERAVDNELIDRNPWAKVAKEAGEARNRLLSDEDEAKLHAALLALPGQAGSDSVGDRWSRFVTLLLETGLRLDEALKIEARDLTYHAGYLHVHGKGRKRLTKCSTCGRLGGKCRDIILTTKARKALADQWTAESRYFTQNESRYREVIVKAAERAKILGSESFPYDSLSPHDLRHSYGHRFLVRGGDIYTLSKQLGHSSVQTTERHYAYLRRDDVARKVLAVMEPKPVLSLVHTA